MGLVPESMWKMHNTEFSCHSNGLDEAETIMKTIHCNWISFAVFIVLRFLSLRTIHHFRFAHLKIPCEDQNASKTTIWILLVFSSRSRYSHYILKFRIFGECLKSGLHSKWQVNFNGVWRILQAGGALSWFLAWHVKFGRGKTTRTSRRLIKGRNLMHNANISPTAVHCNRINCVRWHTLSI